MTRRERTSDRMPDAAEALLSGWPVPARSSLEWEEAASATMARIRSGDDEPTSDDLLAPPMPEAAGEGAFDLELPQNEPRLADIARKALETCGGDAAKDLAKEGLLAAQQTRAAVPMPVPERIAPRARPSTGADVAALQGRLGPHVPAAEEPRSVSALHVAPARSEAPAREPGARGRNTGAFLGGAALAFAAAAALFVSLRHSAPGDPAAATGELSAPAASVAAAPPPEARAAEPRPLAIDQLPAAEVEQPSEAPKSRPTTAAAPMPAPAPAQKSAAARAPQAERKQKLVLEEQEEAASADERNVPAASAAATSPPATTLEQLPAHPSQGAVVAAVGSVMTGARSCLAGQDTGSRATVTFGPDGHVTLVALTGPAAGTPAESCVRSALSAARVPPFTDPSFSAALTVRPP